MVAADGRSLVAATPGAEYNLCDRHETDPSGRLRVVGRELDLAGRVRRDDKERLVRIADGVALTVPDRPGGCADTQDGLYTCPDSGKDMRFVQCLANAREPRLLRFAIVRSELPGGESIARRRAAAGERGSALWRSTRRCATPRRPRL